MNLRPSGYEPDELPGCSTPRLQVSGVRYRAPGEEGEGVLFLVPGPWFLELSSEDLAATYSPAS